MNIKNFNLVYLAIFLVFLGFISCNSDDSPTLPVDPETEHTHEEWHKVTFTFHMGHLHGQSFHGNPFNPEVKYFKAKQEVSFEYDEKGNLILPESPIRLIQGEYYALEINYYNDHDELMNYEFGTEINAPTHQHFFLNKNAKEINSTDTFANADNILDYTYRDTNPVDKNIKEDGVVLRENDPLGLKGYFYVQEAYTEFDLNVILIHIVNGDKFDSNGNPYPFNAPNQAFLSTQDLNVKIPVRVYTERPEDDTDQFFEDMANEFGITAEEAEADWWTQVETPHDSGNFWM